MENVLWVILGHFILDYPMQSEFMALNKGTNNFILMAHSIIYGLGMALIFKILDVFTISKALFLVASHFIIDYVKSHAKNTEKSMTTYLYIDQLLHNIINITLLFK